MCGCICDADYRRPVTTLASLKVADIGSAKRRNHTASPIGQLNATGEYIVYRSGTNLAVEPVVYNYNTLHERVALSPTLYPLGFTPASFAVAVSPWGCTNPYVYYVPDNGGSGLQQFHGFDCRDGSLIGSTPTTPNPYAWIASVDRDMLYAISLGSSFLGPTTVLNWKRFNLATASTTTSAVDYSGFLATGETLSPILSSGTTSAGGGYIALHSRPAGGSTTECAAVRIKPDGSVDVLSNYVNIGTDTIVNSPAPSYDGYRFYWSCSSGSLLYRAGVLTLSATVTFPSRIVATSPTANYRFLGHNWWFYQETDIRYGEIGSHSLYVDGVVTTEPSGWFPDRDGYATMINSTTNGIASDIYRKHNIRAGTTVDQIVLSESFADIVTSRTPVEGTDLQGNTFLFGSSSFQTQSME